MVKLEKAAFREAVTVSDNLLNSVDRALAYAADRCGHRKAAALLRQAAFATGIEDWKSLRPQLAKALVRAVDACACAPNDGPRTPDA